MLPAASLDNHLCTSEVATLHKPWRVNRALPGALQACLDVFTSHCLNAEQSVLRNREDAAHGRLCALSLPIAIRPASKPSIDFFAKYGPARK